MWSDYSALAHLKVREGISPDKYIAVTYSLPSVFRQQCLTSLGELGHRCPFSFFIWFFAFSSAGSFFLLPSILAMWSIFLSPNYVPEPISGGDLRVASLAWGFTLGLSFLTAVKAVRQTAIICQRAHRVTTYVSLVWLEMVVSTIFGSICWFFIDRRIPPRYVQSGSGWTCF